MKDKKFILSSKKKINLKKPFRIEDSNKAVKVTAEAVITPSESALIDSRGLLQMYQQGFLDCAMMQEENVEKDPLEVWNDIKGACEFSFTYRFERGLDGKKRKWKNKKARPKDMKENSKTLK